MICFHAQTFWSLITLSFLIGNILFNFNQYHQMTIALSCYHLFFNNMKYYYVWWLNTKY